MIALSIPACPSIDAALAWVAREAAQRPVVRVVMFRGPDGLVRGLAMVCAEARASA